MVAAMLVTALLVTAPRPFLRRPRSNAAFPVGGLLLLEMPKWRAAPRTTNGLQA